MKKGKIKSIKIGDRIQIIAGNHKGEIGNISSVNPKRQTITVDSITPLVKYIKNKEGNEPKKVELQIPINVSNVMLWDTETNKRGKVGYKMIEKEKKRYFKKSGNIL